MTILTEVIIGIINQIASIFQLKTIFVEVNTMSIKCVPTKNLCTIFAKIEGIGVWGSERMECITEKFSAVFIEIVVLPIYKDTLTFDLFPSAIKVELDTINGLPSSS